MIVLFVYYLLVVLSVMNLSLQTGIEPFSAVNPQNSHTTKPAPSEACFSNLLQRSVSGKYVQTLDELYEVASIARPCFERVLGGLKDAVMRVTVQVCCTTDSHINMCCCLCL